MQQRQKWKNYVHNLANSNQYLKYQHSSSGTSVTTIKEKVTTLTQTLAPSIAYVVFARLQGQLLIQNNNTTPVQPLSLPFTPSNHQIQPFHYNKYHQQQIQQHDSKKQRTFKEY